jgi:hypothetical protein
VTEAITPLLKLEQMQGRCKWPAGAHNRLASRNMRRKMLIEISKRKGKRNKMKTFYMILIAAILAGCSKHDDQHKAAMLKQFVELDSNLVAGIAAANSNELLDISRATAFYSNRAMHAEICLTNYDLASNQLSAAIDRNLIELAHDIGFYEQAARSKRCSVSNQILASKLAWFYTNTTPMVEQTISNDTFGIMSNLLIQLNLARRDELIAACAQEMLLLVDRMSNNAAQERPSHASKPARYQPARPALPSPRQSVNGVPADIYEGIKAEAIKEWPGNFAMQSYEIKRQCEAYRQVNP